MRPVVMGAKKRAIFIVNPAGRGGKSKALWEEMVPRIKKGLGADWEMETRFTGAATEAERISRSYVRSSVEVIVAVGGDGTVNEVVNGFFDESHSDPLHPSGHGPKLAVVPLGTGSDFARQFLWTDDPLEVAQRIRGGATVPIDVGVVTCDTLSRRPNASVDVENEHAGASSSASVSSGPVRTQRVFVNIASMGMSARVANAVAPFKFLGSKLSYVLATVMAFFGHTNIDVQVDYRASPSDKLSTIVIPALTLAAFGNSSYFGGGMKVCPSADPRDGLLQLVSIADYGLIGFALKEGRLRAGTHVGMPRVGTFDLCEATIQAVNAEQGSACWIEADGEVVGSLPATIRVKKAAVDLLV